MTKIYEWIDGLWGWISKHLFVRFTFDLKPEDLRAKHAQGKLVFAIVDGGFIDWLVLSSWSRTQGFGAILVANRKQVLALSKPLFFLQVLFKRRSYADLFLCDEPGPRLFFLKNHERSRLYEPTAGEKVLGEIYSRFAAKGTLPPFEFVPVYFQWRKHMRGTRNLSEYFLGLSSRPNFIGKLWYLLRKRMDSTVRQLDTVTFHAKENEDITDTFAESEAHKAAKSVRRRILILTNQEMRVVLGPRYQSPYSVKEILMKDPEIQAAVTEIAKEEGVDRRKVMMRAYQYFTEIAANYSYRFIEVSYVALTWLFTRVFDGLDSRDSDLQKVRDNMRGKPVVFISCHRSHLDYLVIPYLLFIKDMVTPLVAAGINLAFWPVGPFLRMGGAFIIRRSFRGNKLYSLCLRKYIEYLLKNRFTINFFIEGTRSRSGKMLPPAYGLLKMTLDCVRNKVLEDIAFIPVSICYDEVLEEKSYTKELMGGEKEKENTAALIKSGKIIKRNIGKVYVRIADPIFAKESHSSAEAAGVDPTLMLQKLAFQLCKSINDVTPVTPKSIVSGIFLCHRLESLSTSDVIRNSEKLAEYVEFSGIEMSVHPGEGFHRSVEKTLRRLEGNGTIRRHEGGTYGCESKRRVGLNFYKNNAIHCFVVPSIALLAFFRTLGNQKVNEPFYDQVVRSAVDLRNTLKFEFFFSPTPVFVNELRRCFEFFLGNGEWEDATADQWAEAIEKRFPTLDDLTVYLGQVSDLLESYSVAAACLKELAHETMEKKMLLARMAKFGVSLEEHGGISFPESISTQNYSNALLLFENTGFLKMKKEDSGTTVEILAWNNEMETLSQQLTGFLDLLEKSPDEILHS